VILDADRVSPSVSAINVVRTRYPQTPIVVIKS
jgi:hypothetical protein